MGWQTELIPFLIAGNTTIINQNGQLLMYNGIPAANNLLLAESPTDFTDQFGNQGFAGLNIYSPLLIGPQYRMLSFRNTSLAMILYYNTTPAQNSWIQGAAVSFPSTTEIQLTADAIVTLAVTGGIFTTFNIDTVQLSGQGSIPSTSFVTNAANLWSNFNGNAALASGAGAAAGLNSHPGYIKASQEDLNIVTNPGTGTGPIQTSAIWTIPKDLAVGTHYVLEVPFSGTLEGNNVTLGLSIDGSATYTTSAGILGTFVGLGVGFVGSIKMHVRCTATGVSGSMLSWVEGGYLQRAAVSQPSNSGYLSAAQNTATIDTTVTHTFRMNTSFAAITAGQNVSGSGSTLHRYGP